MCYYRTGKSAVKCNLRRGTFSKIALDSLVGRHSHSLERSIHQRNPLLYAPQHSKTTFSTPCKLAKPLWEAIVGERRFRREWVSFRLEWGIMLNYPSLGFPMMSTSLAAPLLCTLYMFYGLCGIYYHILC